MKIISILLVLVITSFFVGCVPVDSLNPIYTDKDVIFEPVLVGTWVGENPDEGGLRITRAGDNAYQLVMNERESGSWLKESVFDAHLVSLGGQKFFDLQPRQLQLSDEAELNAILSKSGVRFDPSLIDIGGGLFLEFLGAGPRKAKSQAVNVRLRAAHWIFRVDMDHGILRLEYLDNEWIENEIKRGTLLARHQKAATKFDSKWVLTGSTPEMQQFVVGQADREGAFSGVIVLKQQKEASHESSSPGT